jgi:hypothetical protein
LARSFALSFSLSYSLVRPLSSSLALALSRTLSSLRRLLYLSRTHTRANRSRCVASAPTVCLAVRPSTRKSGAR